MNAIIIYYSRSGNTEKLANKIQNDIGCKKLKIIPTEAYGNYLQSVGRVMKERSKNIVPTFDTAIPDLSQYDVVFLGFPIWAQDVPAFVVDFIKQCDIKGKIVIPFATYGMSDIQWAMKTLKELCKGSDLRLPFDQGMFKKQNYEEWIAKVKKLLME